jgi:hypothetical protein
MIEFAPRTIFEMTFDEAILYCRFLEYNGHKDWRIPTADEYYTYARILGWYCGRELHDDYAWQVTPVRDI